MLELQQQQWGKDYFFNSPPEKVIRHYRLAGHKAIKLSLKTGHKLEISR